MDFLKRIDRECTFEFFAAYALQMNNNHKGGFEFQYFFFHFCSTVEEQFLDLKD